MGPEPGRIGCAVRAATYIRAVGAQRHRNGRLQKSGGGRTLAFGINRGAAVARNAGGGFDEAVLRNGVSKTGWNSGRGYEVHLASLETIILPFGGQTGIGEQL